MNKHFFISVCAVLCTVLFSSCDGNRFDLNERLKELQQRQEHFDSIKDDLDREAATLKDADTLFADKWAGAPGSKKQGLCCQTEWTISLPQCNGKKGFLGIAQDIYNVSAAQNAIMADYEIHERYLFAGNALVDSIHVLNSIQSLSPECIKNEDLREITKEYQDGVVWRITHPNDDESSVRELNDALSQYISDNYLTNRDCPCFIDTTELFKMYELDIDTTGLSSESELWKNKELWWKELQENDDIDRRIAIAIQAAKYTHIADRWPLEVMMALMQSRQYSPLLPKLWRTWRCCTQLLYVGGSRDSVIPNYTYDRYRRLVYTTIIDHLIEHPDDKQALAAAQYLIIITNLVRNGDFWFGSNCLLEVYQLGMMEKENNFIN